MKKLALATAFLALLTVTATGAWANAIPPQLTLSSSSNGGITFSNNGSSISFWFTGTTAECQHPSCLSGNALLEPQTLLGTYWMWMTGPNPSLTGSLGNYTVNMNGGVIHFALMLTASGDTLATTLSLSDLFGGMGMTPTFDGTFGGVSVNSIGALAADFPNGTSGTVDFTVKIVGGPSVGTLGTGQQVSGYISSGELVPTPEPTSLALLGTGVLGLAGAIRRKINR